MKTRVPAHSFACAMRVCETLDTIVRMRIDNEEFESEVLFPFYQRWRIKENDVARYSTPRGSDIPDLRVKVSPHCYYAGGTKLIPKISVRAALKMFDGWCVENGGYEYVTVPRLPKRTAEFVGQSSYEMPTAKTIILGYVLSVCPSMSEHIVQTGTVPDLEGYEQIMMPKVFDASRFCHSTYKIV